LWQLATVYKRFTKKTTIIVELNEKSSMAQLIENG